MKAMDYSNAPVFSRQDSFRKILQLLRQKVNPNIIEIGCIRSKNDIGAGNSSELLAWFVSKYGGRFTTCDNSSNNIIFCSQIINKYRNINCKINAVIMNGINFLASTDEIADFLYLDATDANGEIFMESASIHFQMFKAYESKIKPGCIIAIDDIVNFEKEDLSKYNGKGYCLIPYFLNEKKYDLIHAGYQYVFIAK